MGSADEVIHVKVTGLLHDLGSVCRRGPRALAAPQPGRSRAYSAVLPTDQFAEPAGPSLGSEGSGSEGSWFHQWRTRPSDQAPPNGPSLGPSSSGKVDRSVAGGLQCSASTVWCARAGSAGESRGIRPASYIKQQSRNIELSNPRQLKVEEDVKLQFLKVKVAKVKLCTICYSCSLKLITSLNPQNKTF